MGGVNGGLELVDTVACREEEIIDAKRERGEFLKWSP